MSTTAGDLSGELFGKTRRNVLALLLTRPDESFYLREVARRTGSPLGAVQRELGDAKIKGLGTDGRFAHAYASALACARAALYAEGFEPDKGPFRPQVHN